MNCKSYYPFLDVFSFKFKGKVQQKGCLVYEPAAGQNHRLGHSWSHAEAGRVCHCRIHITRTAPVKIQTGQ